MQGSKQKTDQSVVNLSEFTKLLVFKFIANQLNFATFNLYYFGFAVSIRYAAGSINLYI